MTSRITVSRQVPTTFDVHLAVQRTAPYLRRTPLLRTRLRGRPLLLKLEHLQLTGAFKLRGALNALLTGDRGERVVTASGGNHGLGVATAAHLLGGTATVYVPETVPAVKEQRLRDAGADVVRAGTEYAAAEAAARAYADAGLATSTPTTTRTWSQAKARSATRSSPTHPTAMQSPWP